MSVIKCKWKYVKQSFSHTSTQKQPLNNIFHPKIYQHFQFGKNLSTLFKLKHFVPEDPNKIYDRLLTKNFSFGVIGERIIIKVVFFKLTNQRFQHD